MTDDMLAEITSLRAELRDGFADIRAALAAIQVAVSALADRHHELAARVEHRANGHSNGHAE